MTFEENRPIYLQIADAICLKILSGELKGGQRIDSVREYGAKIGVNPNTVMRSYEKLTELGIIYNRRGIGYFVSEKAAEVVLEKERKDFIERELPNFRKRMELLKFSFNDINKL